MPEELHPWDPRAIGGYRVIRPLGYGARGRTYLAVGDDGQLLAVKVIHDVYTWNEEFRPRLREEMAAVRVVAGRFLAPVIDANPDAHPPWLAAPYIGGPSLAQLVHDQGPLAVADVLVLGRGVAAALQDIHAAGVVHGHLSPSNVLLAPDGPRVADFGISDGIDPTSGDLPWMNDSDRVAYLAPEQFGAGPVAGTSNVLAIWSTSGTDGPWPATDVFSLGSLLAFAAVGRAPFSQGNLARVLHLIIEDRPDLTAVPGQLRPAITACLAADPRQRPSLDEVIAMLGEPAAGAVASEPGGGP